MITGVITGSFSVISEAIHSTSDLLASFIAFFAVKKASKPADKDHAFGHGKYEDFSGLIEGLLIILASIYILWEASMKVISGKYGNEPERSKKLKVAGYNPDVIQARVNKLLGV